MKFRLSFVLCLVAIVAAGCNKPSNETPARPFDMNLILGMTETQLVALLGEPTEKEAYNSGFMRNWVKGDLYLQVAFNPSGYPKKYVCYDFSKTPKPSQESLRQTYNVSATDTRYRVRFGHPDQDGAVTIMHVEPR